VAASCRRPFARVAQEWRRSLRLSHTHYNTTNPPHQWELANNVPLLVELLLLPPSKEGPLATRAQAALWLAAYVGLSSPSRRDEAFKAGVAELAAKLAGASSSEDAVVAAALTLLAAIARGPLQYREAVMGARPSVLVTVQNLIASTGRSSCTAAAVGACWLSVHCACVVALLLHAYTADESRVRHQHKTPASHAFTAS